MIIYLSEVVRRQRRIFPGHGGNNAWGAARGIAFPSGPLASGWAEPSPPTPEEPQR